MIMVANIYENLQTKYQYSIKQCVIYSYKPPVNNFELAILQVYQGVTTMSQLSKGPHVLGPDPEVRRYDEFADFPEIRKK